MRRRCRETLRVVCVEFGPRQENLHENAPEMILTLLCRENSCETCCRLHAAAANGLSQGQSVAARFREEVEAAPTCAHAGDLGCARDAIGPPFGSQV